MGFGVVVEVCLGFVGFVGVGVVGLEGLVVRAGVASLGVGLVVGLGVWPRFLFWGKGSAQLCGLLYLLIAITPFTPIYLLVVSTIISDTIVFGVIVLATIKLYTIILIFRHFLTFPIRLIAIVLILACLIVLQKPIHMSFLLKLHILS